MYCVPFPSLRFSKSVTADSIHHLGSDGGNSNLALMEMVCGSSVEGGEPQLQLAFVDRRVEPGRGGEWDFSLSSLERASTGQHTRVIQHLEIIEPEGCASELTTQILPPHITLMCLRVYEHTHTHTDTHTHTGLLGLP